MGVKKWLYKKVARYLNQEGPSKYAHLCDFDRLCHEIRPADVLLVQGRSPISHLISRVTRSSWTHSALYLGRLHDVDDPVVREQIQKNFHGSPREPLLIESMLGQGTIVTPLDHYKNDHIRICRPSGLTHTDAQAVVAGAVRQLGNEYDVHHLFDLFRFYLGVRFIPKRWKSVIFEGANKSAKDVCSVMIAYAFASIKFPILPLVSEEHLHKYKFIRRNPGLCKPADFDFSPYFDIVKYPMVLVSAKAVYRNLPWVENYVSDDDAHIHKVKGTEEQDD